MKHSDTTHQDIVESTPLESNYRIRIDIKDIGPKDPSFFDRFYRRGGKPAFIVAKRFNIEFQLTNVGHSKFPGGELVLSVRWTSKVEDWYRIEIPPLAEGETTEPYIRDYGVIESGYGMIFAKGQPYSDFKQLEKKPWVRNLTSPFNVFLKDMNLGDTGAHISSLFGQTEEDFFEFFAMIIAAIGLFYILLKDIVGLIFSWCA